MGKKITDAFPFYALTMLGKELDCLNCILFLDCEDDFDSCPLTKLLEDAEE